jgi:prolipoprotein diacylglyceryltransferase
MARIPEFAEIVQRMLVIHEKKNHDYASDENPFSNFELSALIANHFYGIHTSFAALIGTKLGRLAELLKPGKVPKNESVEDTLDDLATYAVLWGALYRRLISEAEKWRTTFRGKEIHTQR